MTLALFLCIWWRYREIQSQFLPPQAMLVLGGSTKHLEREKFTAEFAHKHPNLPIWITGGSPPNSTQQVFIKAGVNPKLLHLDYEAVDTLTNFTTLVDDLQARGVKRVFLITSDFHMLRASVIGEIILGSRGITFKPVSVPSEQSPEPISKSIRDGARAIIWVATGYTAVDQSKTGH